VGSGWARGGLGLGGRKENYRSSFIIGFFRTTLSTTPPAGHPMLLHGWLSTRTCIGVTSYWYLSVPGGCTSGPTGHQRRYRRRSGPSPQALPVCDRHVSPFCGIILACLAGVTHQREMGVLAYICNNHLELIISVQLHHVWALSAIFPFQLRFLADTAENSACDYPFQLTPSSLRTCCSYDGFRQLNLKNDGLRKK